MLKRSHLSVCTLALFAATPSIGHSADALIFGGGITYSSATSYSVGWSFTSIAPITVSGLSWFDVGTWSSSEVGIYNSSNTLLTSTTVLSSDPLSHGFRSHAIAPIVLPAGTYKVAGVGKEFYCELSESNVSVPISYISMAFPLIYGSAFYTTSSSLVVPTNAGNRGKGYFGPSFQTGSAPVPEPGTYAALALGTITVLRRKRR